MIKDLDDRIAASVFGGLNEQQDAELNQMLDVPTTSDEEFQAFFERNGIDVEGDVTSAIRLFNREYLGGENA